MTSPIDPLRRAARLRRIGRASRASQVNGASEAGGYEDRSVPVVIEPAAPPAPDHAAEGVAAFNAHLLGQGGVKRGLRGGPETLEAAKSVYVKTEWSGPADRRAPKGSITKTEI